MGRRGRLGIVLTALAIAALLVANGVVAAERRAGVAPRLAQAPPVRAAHPVSTEATPEPVVTPPRVPSPTDPLRDPVPVASSEPTEDETAGSFPAVSARRASVAVTVAPGDEGRVRELLASLEGVVEVAGVTVVATTLGGVPAEVAAVDVDEYRPFTPDATANHRPLWERIAAGDLAVTHEFGTVHEVPLGSEVASGIDLPTGDPLTFRVGAFATNGTPPVADAIVDEASLPALGAVPVEGERRLLVSLEDLASPTATVEALVAADVAATEIPDPRAPRSEPVIPTGGITPENVWDHLAMCESSGDWHINTGNGYYGGLQFLPESWTAVGGQGLPHEHPRTEQIYRATLLWQIQGWEAWPQCARKLGLIVDPPPQPTPRPTGAVVTESPE